MQTAEVASTQFCAFTLIRADVMLTGHPAGTSTAKAGTVDARCSVARALPSPSVSATVIE